MITIPKAVAVLDTNVYRGTSASVFPSLRVDEERAGVIPMANTWSVMELLAHLSDPADPARGPCLSAVRKMWDHCRWAGPNALPFAGDSESQMTLSLFGTSIAGRPQEAALMGYVVQELAKDSFATARPGLQDVLDGLKQHRDDIEQGFATDMQSVVRSLDPTSTGWQPWPNDSAKRAEFLQAVKAGQGLPLLAEALVIKASEAVGATPAEDEVKSRAQFVIDHFPTPLHFYDLQITKVVQSGIPFTQGKHANSIWDMQLCFYGIPGATILHLPVVLVTNERSIHQAAGLAGASTRVKDFATYQTQVSSGSLILS